MSAIWVFSAYGCAFLLAIALLFVFRAGWFWHLLSVAAAMGLGLVRFPDNFRPPDLLVGSVFVLLFFWGVGGLFVRPRRLVKPAAHATRAS